MFVSALLEASLWQDTAQGVTGAAPQHCKTLRTNVLPETLSVSRIDFVSHQVDLH